jgi:hypothetical protein
VKRLAVLMAVLLLSSTAALPALGTGASVKTIRDFPTVVSLGFADNDFGVGLMEAWCDFLTRVERPDGTATETMSCQITGEWLPGFEADEIPIGAWIDAGGECIWYSDYFAQTTGEAIFGSSYMEVVTPSGEVHVTIEYDSDPPTAEECFPDEF